MKKLLITFLTLSLLCSFVSCGNSSSDISETPESSILTENNVYTLSKEIINLIYGNSEKAAYQLKQRGIEFELNEDDTITLDEEQYRIFVDSVKQTYFNCIRTAKETGEFYETIMSISNNEDLTDIELTVSSADDYYNSSDSTLLKQLLLSSMLYQKVLLIDDNKIEVTYHLIDTTTDKEFGKATLNLNDMKKGNTNTETATTRETTTVPQQQTYESSEYFDLVETYSYKSFLGRTYVIDKVLAKKSGAVQGIAIARDENGNIIGTSKEKISLTKGKYNYFKYDFDPGCNFEKLEKTVQEADNLLKGTANAVEVIEYNQSQNSLYINLKQTGERLNPLSQLKILFFKEGELVDTFEGAYCIYASTLDGKDTQAVAEISTWGINNYDTLEIFLED